MRRVLLFSAVFLIGTATLRAESPQSAPVSLLEQAYILDAGEQGKRDASAAAELYQRAAAEGDAMAHFRLGYMNEVGDGVPQDYDLARSHFEQAVRLGLEEARMRLAICHLEGWGGPRDEVAFRREMEIVAETGYKPAQRALAGAYLIGVGGPRDDAAGKLWLERLANEDDDAQAQSRLGSHLDREARRDFWGKADRELARTWFQLSAEQDYTEAMRGMARSLIIEGNRGQYAETARRWLELAVESGDAESPFTLGVLSLINSTRIAGDPDEAQYWFETAAKRGHRRAQEVLAMTEQGLPLKKAVGYVQTTPNEDRYTRSLSGRWAKEDAGTPNQRPLPLNLVKPLFPQSLRVSEIEGQAIIDFVVDTTGRVRIPKVREATHPLFGEHAVSAVSQWRFRPGRKNGRLVNTRMAVPVVFNLSDANTMDGVDGLLGWVREEARYRGGQMAEDAVDLRMAKPLSKLRALDVPVGRTPPEKSRFVLLLSLDADGKPLRSHLVHAEPEWLGEQARERSLEMRYRPRMIGDEAVAGNVVLPMFWKPDAPDQK